MEIEQHMWLYILLFAGLLFLLYRTVRKHKKNELRYKNFSITPTSSSSSPSFSGSSCSASDLPSRGNTDWGSSIDCRSGISDGSSGNSGSIDCGSIGGGDCSGGGSC